MREIDGERKIEGVGGKIVIDRKNIRERRKDRNKKRIKGRMRMRKRIDR